MKKVNYDDLQLFAEGAEGSEGGQETAETVAVPAEPQVDGELVQRHWDGVERIYRGLAEQAEGVKGLYPDFDLGAEMRNPLFAGMLRAGVDMQSAVMAVHAGEIIPAMMQYAAQMVEQRLSSAMRSGLDRPSENGLRGGNAVKLGSEVARLSRQDYDKICRMVERGERVSFG